jgi:heptaprenyl diphosphate synthase
LSVVVLRDDPNLDLVELAVEGTRLVVSLPVVFADPKLTAEITSGLAAVEERLQTAVNTPHSVLDSAARHLIEAGGKRIRPLLVLLAAQFGERRDGRILSAAAAVELIHLATLYHDDVMDRAMVRRGVPSANAQWGPSLAVWTGDYLFARAAQIIADLGQDVIRIQAETFARLVEGQRAETEGPVPGEDSIDHYLRVLKDKTASLFATSGEFGALLSDAPVGVTSRIRQACTTWGMAFQMSDDLLDILSDDVESGKEPGTDLREGVPTLPVLYVLRSADPADARLLELLRLGGLVDLELHSEALSLLRAHRALDVARTDIRRWAQAAKEQFRSLPDIPSRRGLEMLCDMVAERTR